MLITFAYVAFATVAIALFSTDAFPPLSTLRSLMLFSLIRRHYVTTFDVFATCHFHYFDYFRHERATYCRAAFATPLMLLAAATVYDAYAMMLTPCQRSIRIADRLFSHYAYAIAMIREGKVPAQ